MLLVKLINRGLAQTLGITIKKARNSHHPEPFDAAPIGMVESFSQRKAIGWISAEPEDFPIKVTINVNGFPVHGTWADVKSTRNTSRELRSFRIANKGVWDFCQKSDRLTIQFNGRVLPIYNRGIFRKPPEDGTKTLDDLKKLLNEGYVFNHWGKLQLSKKLDTEWQKQIMNLYNSTSKILNEKHNIKPFLIYGSLLGQVREGGFIGHDGDFDMAYISKHSNGQDAALELKDVALTLIHAGFNVEQKATSIHIHDKDDPELRIDLFHLFFNEQEELSFPFGIAGTSQFSRKDWGGTTNGTFSGYPVLVPTNAEKLVEHMYGSSWRTPIAGFNWGHARTKRDRSGIVPNELREEVNQTNTQLTTSKQAK